MNLYARSVHAGNFINLSKGDKLRKKTARELLWKAQNYIPYIDYKSFYGILARQNAYKIILQAEKSIKDISTVKEFSDTVSGVPLITPVTGSIDKPLGKEPSAIL